MNTFKDHPEIFRECYATHEFLRRLGFQAREIFLHLRADQMMVVLHTQNKTFAVLLGKVDFNEQQMLEHWSDIVDGLVSHKITEDEVQEVWTNSFIYANMNDCLLTMRNKGLFFPSLIN